MTAWNARPALLALSLTASVLITGCATSASAAPARPAPATAVRRTVGDAACTGYAAPATATLRTVDYDTLPARPTFTRRAASAAGEVLRIRPRVVRFHDFEPAAGTYDGGVVGGEARGLIGAGMTRTFLEIARHSSTRAGMVPTVAPATNQLDVLRITGAAHVLRRFTVRATPQGHLYNGLRIDRVRHLRADFIRVVGIPGDDHAPPGETFGINDYRTVGSRWSHIIVDGTHVGASGFGVNGSRGIRICDAVSQHNRYAMGFAFWQTRNIRLVDCRALDNGFAGFNFERVSGTVRLIRPVARHNTYGLRIASDRGSARFVIRDPGMTDGRFTVTLPNRWNGTVNRQKRSDITLIVHGRMRPDLLRFHTY